MLEDRLNTIDVASMRKIGTLVNLVAAMPKEDPRYALFLGAGASISSGIPAAGRLTELWLRRVFVDTTGRTTWNLQDDSDLKAWVRDGFPAWRKEWESQFGLHPSPYSVLFSYAFPDPDNRQGFIERIASGCEPGPGYIYLAALTLAGHFHTFLTTNYDDLIHDALFRYGGLKPKVCAFDSQVKSIRLQSPRPKIIKLHGDFLYNNIRSVGPEVARLDHNMEEKLDQTCEGYGLIVIGYSGQDQSVMAPLRSLLHRRDRLTHGLHWCVFRSEKEAQESTRNIPDELYRMWKAYPDKVHLYDVGSFDECMEAFYLGCNCQPPPELAHPEDKALYARLRDGLENADQTWRMTSGFSDLLRQFRAASARKPSEEVTLLDEADEQHRKARALLKKGDFQGAQASFEAAAAGASKALTASADRLDPFLRIRASRRFGGSHANVLEVVTKQNDGRIPKSARKTAREILDRSLERIRDGLAIDREILSPPELRGHRINLWYNGLCCHGFAKLMSAKLDAGDREQAAAWLHLMAADEMLGDEFVELLGTEPGGNELLVELRSPVESGENLSCASPSTEASE